MYDAETPRRLKRKLPQDLYKLSFIEYMPLSTYFYKLSDMLVNVTRSDTLDEIKKRFFICTA